MARPLLRGPAIAFVVAACSSRASGTEDAGTDGDSGRGSSDSSSSATSDTDTGIGGGDTGGGDAGGGDAGGGDGAVADALAETEGGPNAFTLTSPAFGDMGMIGAMYQCTGGNVSPPLDWTPGPAGTQSYAVVMTDANTTFYWLIWDIPAATTSLPEGVDRVAMPVVPAGSEQDLPGVDAATAPGYAGPCPQLPLTPYTFAVYALSVATLPGVTTTSMGAAVFVAIQASTLASAKLTGLATHGRS